MSTVTDNFPMSAPETSGNKSNLMGEDIFVLDGADLLDTLLLANDCVSCYIIIATLYTRPLCMWLRNSYNIIEKISLHIVRIPSHLYRDEKNI